MTEKYWMKKTLPGFQHHSRYVDEGSPLPPIQLPRGYGGSSISWRDELNSIIESLPDGSNRTVCIKINSSPSVIIIATYAPCKGCSKYNEEYMEILAEWQELLNKYKGSNDVLICGDLNASLHSEYPDARDKLLKDFCTKNQLELVPNYPVGKTFECANGSSQIDYIIASNIDLIKQVQHVSKEYDNCSDHIPIRAVITVKESSMSNNVLKPVQERKLQWGER